MTGNECIEINDGFGKQRLVVVHFVLSFFVKFNSVFFIFTTSCPQFGQVVWVEDWYISWGAGSAVRRLI